MLDDFTMRLIRRTARRLIGKFGYTPSDRDDLEQDIVLEVLRRRPNISDSVKCRRAYLTALVQRCALNLAKRHNATKRSVDRCQSLNRTIREADGQWVEHAKAIDETQRLTHRGCQVPPTVERVDREIDVASLIEKLPDELRSCCRDIMSGIPLYRVAARVGMAPSTLRRTLREHLGGQELF